MVPKLKKPKNGLVITLFQTLADNRVMITFLTTPLEASSKYFEERDR